MEQQSSANGRSRVAAYVDREVIGYLEDFKDPSQEWRRLFSELLGTFSSSSWQPAAG